MKTSVLFLFVTFPCVLTAVPKKAGQKRTPNSIGAITNSIHPDDIIRHRPIGPILVDILCRVCSDIADKKKRENCIKKFCVGTANFSTSAAISTFSTSSSITKLARSSGSLKLARSSGISKLARSSGISKLARSSGISKLARSSGISKLARSSGISKLARSSGISKLARSSGISKLARSSGVPKTSTSSGISKSSSSSGISKSSSSSGISKTSTSSGISKFSTSSAVSKSSSSSGVSKYSKSSARSPNRQKRIPNSIGAIADNINPNDITHHSSIVPILADILCRLCSKIADKKKRENCIKKFCVGISTFPTSAGISQLARSSGITKLARSSGISKLARSSGLTKFLKSSGTFKFPASSGVSTPSTSSGVSKFSKSSARSSNLRSQINKYVYAGNNDKIRPEDQSKVMISNLTDILCKLCNNLSDKAKRRDCSVKYCLRSIGALPFIPLRNRHSLRKIRKSNV